MKLGLTCLGFSVFFVACSASTPTKLDTDDPRACAQNFSYSGSFLAGRTYKTHASVAGVSSTQAIKSASQYIASNGYQINNVDKDLGIINASQTVSHGDGKTAPLNVNIENMGEVIKASVTYSTSGGVTAPLEAVVEETCNIIGAIEQNH